MTIKSSTLWTAYWVVQIAGTAGLGYALRRPHVGWAMLWLPFAMPLLLVGIAAMAARIPPPQGEARRELTLTGREVMKFPPVPPRPTTLMAWGMIHPFYTRIFPDYVGVPDIRGVFLLLWWGCAAFIGLGIPRLVRNASRQAPESGRQLPTA
jgi:hypothetical protein